MTTNAKGMKPSERIKNIIYERTISNPEISSIITIRDSIVQYLDEQHEAKGEV